MDKRSFPRYNILSLNAYLLIDGIEEQKVWVKDISLGGLQLFHHKKIDYLDNQNATFFLGQKFIRKLKVKEVWAKESKAQFDLPLQTGPALTKKLESIEHLSGIQLYFDNHQEFKNWRTLVQAMHKHKLKK